MLKIISSGEALPIFPPQGNKNIPLRWKYFIGQKAQRALWVTGDGMI
jgi:hypothetical protein